MSTEGLTLQEKPASLQSGHTAQSSVDTPPPGLSSLLFTFLVLPQSKGTRFPMRRPVSCTRSYTILKRNVLLTASSLETWGPVNIYWGTCPSRCCSKAPKPDYCASRSQHRGPSCGSVRQSSWVAAKSPSDLLFLPPFQISIPGL